MTLDGTINPDFSQVESDSFQVQVNQRYPVFYSEKRPFFMEGMGVFELAGSGGDGNMATAVHTRRIVDPAFGVKLSGTLGKVTFGTISAADSAAGRLDPQYDGKRQAVQHRPRHVQPRAEQLRRRHRHGHRVCRRLQPRRRRRRLASIRRASR